MLRGIAAKVAWAGRTASMVFGLALIMALIFGVVSVGLAANGNPFLLGKAKNTATKVTGLIGKVASGPALKVTNPSGGPALELRANGGVAPMTVNAEAGTATNLDADKLDALNSTDFQRANAAAGGGLTGSYPDPQINTGAVRSQQVQDGSLLAGDIAVLSTSHGPDLGSIAPGSCRTGGFTNSQANVGDLPILIAPANLPDGLTAYGMRVFTDDIVQYRLCNISGAAIDPPELFFRLVVLRP